MSATMSNSKMEHRKMRKVMVERQRRDRIERCFEQLNIMLQQSKTSTHIGPIAGISKVEKAELLEMIVGHVWRVRADLVRQMSLGFDSCLREVDAFFARPAPSRRPVTSSSIASSSSTDPTKPETSRSFDVDDDRAIREHLLHRLTHCSARLRRASVSSSLEAASGTTSAPTSATSTSAVLVPDVRLERNPTTPSLSTAASLRRLRRDDINENFNHHSVAPSSRVVSGRIMRVNASHAIRPLRDINGNVPMRFKSADDRCNRSATRVDVEDNVSKVAPVAAVLPLTLVPEFPVRSEELTRDLHRRCENIGVGREHPTNVDHPVDDVALDFRARHAGATGSQQFTSGRCTRCVPEASVVKVEPLESETNDVWRPW